MVAWMLPNLYNASSLRKKLIKLTHYDETKKRARDSQIVRAKENIKFTVEPRWAQPKTSIRQQPANESFMSGRHWV